MITRPYLLLLLALSACSTAPMISERAELFEKGDVVGKWFGFSQADHVLYSCVLNPDMRGTVAYHHTGGTNVSVFHILAWELENPNVLNVQFPIDGEPTRIHGHLVTPTSFVGYVEGTFRSNRWTNEVQFYREDSVLERLRLLHRASDLYWKSRKGVGP